MRYAAGHESHSNRIAEAETSVQQLWVHLLCAGHGVQENRMSRGHVCVAICDRAVCVRPDTCGLVHSQLRFAEVR